MPCHHDESKLQARQEGRGPIVTAWAEPGSRNIPDMKLEVGSKVILHSSKGVPILAELRSLQGDQVVAKILGFEQWADEVHDGMAPGDTIMCDLRYVISHTS